jgi:hypothetical protein
MKDYSTYMKENTKVPYKTKSDFTTAYVYSKGAVVYTGPVADIPEEMRKFVAETVVDEEAYKTHNKAYVKEQTKVYEQWVKELFDEVGADYGNPSHRKLYEVVYRDKHSCMSDVVGTFEEYFYELEKFLK